MAWTHTKYSSHESEKRVGQVTAGGLEADKRVITTKPLPPSPLPPAITRLVDADHLLLWAPAGNIFVPALIKVNGAEYSSESNFLVQL